MPHPADIRYQMMLKPNRTQLTPEVVTLRPQRKLELAPMEVRKLILVSTQSKMPELFPVSNQAKAEKP